MNTLSLTGDTFFLLAWNLHIFCLLRSLLKPSTQVVTVCIIYSNIKRFVLYRRVHKCVVLIVAIFTDIFPRQHSPIGLCDGGTLRSVQTESLRLVEMNVSPKGNEDASRTL
jgi:hypothetical protein